MRVIFAITTLLQITFSDAWSQHPDSLAERRMRILDEFRVPPTSTPLPGVQWPHSGRRTTGGSFRLQLESGARDYDTTLAVALLRGLDSIRTIYGVVGMSAAMMIPGQGVWEGVSGISSAGDTIHPNMLFCIASNTKTFMSTLILQLVEQGLLSLDDSIGRWVPPYPNIPGSVTLRQLLNMTSGVFDYLNDSPAAFDSILADPLRYWSPQEILTTFVGPAPLPPGVAWRYSNTNHVLLGLAIRAATSSQVGLELRQRIWNPLQLSRTFLEIEDTLIEPIAHPWYQGSDMYSFPRTALYSLAWTAGGMFSTAKDMARWANSLYSGQVLTQSSMNSMMTFVPTSGSLPGGFVLGGYGLGMQRLYLTGRTIYSHSGHMPGYLSEVTGFSRTGAGLALLINQSPAAPLYETLSVLWNIYFRSLATAPAVQGTMYATSTASGGRLLSVDRTTAATSVIGPTDYPQISSLRVHPVTRELIGLAGSEIVRVDAVLGGAYPISTLSITNAKGMDFRGDTLYVGTISGGIYRVDISSGATSLVASSGIQISGLAFHPVTGQLWASVRPPLFGRDRIYKIDLPSGDTTLVGTTGFGQVTQDILFDESQRLYGVTGTGSQQNSLIAIDTATAAGTLIGLMGTSVVALALWPDSGSVYVKELPPIPGPTLAQNFPNPFNPTTQISFQIPRTEHVSLFIHDILGRHVTTLVNEVKPAGHYTVTWDATGMGSGIYFSTLRTGHTLQTRKLVLMR